jgi:hypothetical protein
VLSATMAATLQRSFMKRSCRFFFWHSYGRLLTTLSAQTVKRYRHHDMMSPSADRAASQRKHELMSRQTPIRLLRPLRMRMSRCVEKSGNLNGNGQSPPGAAKIAKLTDACEQPSGPMPASLSFRQSLRQRSVPRGQPHHHPTDCSAACIRLRAPGQRPDLSSRLFEAPPPPSVHSRVVRIAPASTEAGARHRGASATRSSITPRCCRVLNAASPPDRDCCAVSTTGSPCSHPTRRRLAQSAYLGV